MAVCVRRILMSTCYSKLWPFNNNTSGVCYTNRVLPMFSILTVDVRLYNGTYVHYMTKYGIT